MIAFPDKFIKRLKNQFPQEYNDLLSALDSRGPVSLRINEKKAKIEEFNRSVPWANSGRYLDQRPAYALDPLFHSGAYYPQEASSMILEQIVNRISSITSIQRCIDLCASPGGKSTHLLSLIPSSSVLVSNEIIPKRFSVLYENLIKWGHPNFIATNSRPDQIVRLGELFDVVLVDAPCSGEGLFRKQEIWREKWTLDNCNLCANRQNQILDSATKLVRPGGFLIYSTCTLNPEENIDQINYLLQNEELESINIPALKSFGFIEQSMNAGVGYLALPHLVDGEPFFIACLQRKGDSTPDVRRKSLSMYQQQHVQEELLGWQESFYRMENMLYDMNVLQAEMSELLQKSKIRQRIAPVGEYKKTIFIPHHFLAMHIKLANLGTGKVLDKEQALAYLRHEQISIEFDQKGWHVLSYHGVKIGWIKYDGRRIINKYPMNWRLRLTK